MKAWKLIVPQRLLPMRKSFCHSHRALCLRARDRFGTWEKLAYKVENEIVL